MKRKDKYNEGAILKEFEKYVEATYDQHYNHNKYQASEFIMDAGHGTGFFIGNIMKYAQRYGKKGKPEDWRKDLFKILHFTTMMINQHDINHK